MFGTGKATNASATASGRSVVAIADLQSARPLHALDASIIKCITERTEVVLGPQPRVEVTGHPEDRHELTRAWVLELFTRSLWRDALALEVGGEIYADGSAAFRSERPTVSD